MNDTTPNLNPEWVIIGLISVLILNSILGILLFFGIVMASADLNPFEIISSEIIINIIKASVYWLAAVGALWFVAHLLGLRRWYVLAGIGAAVALGLTLLMAGARIDPAWTAVHMLRAALMGWVLWRLAYRQPAPNTGAHTGAYQTTTGRVIAALLSGSAVGVAATMAIATLLFGRMEPRDFEEIWGAVLIFWFGGVFILGGISFAALHFIGLRRWYGMTIVGGLIMLVLGLIMLKGVVEIKFLLIVALSGSVVGWVIWRVAYRRVET